MIAEKLFQEFRWKFAPNYKKVQPFLLGNLTRHAYPAEDTGGRTPKTFKSFSKSQVRDLLNGLPTKGAMF